MPISAAEMQVKINKHVVNMDRWDGIVNGDNNADITTDAGPVPSVAKYFKTAALARPLTVTGGTANAIQVSAPSAFIAGRIYSIIPTATNTNNATITVATYGTYPVVYPDGTNIRANDLLLGALSILIFTGTQFQLIFGYAEIVELVSASSVSLLPVATRTALKAVDTNFIKAVILLENGREGIFKWVMGDFTALIAEDTREGMYVKANAVSAGTGAWVRMTEYLTPRMFGAIADGIVDDLAPIQDSWKFSSRNRLPVVMEGLEYNCSETLLTSSYLNVIGSGATLYIVNWPTLGGFITNVGPVVENRVQNNVYMQDLVADGVKLPHPYQRYAYPLQANNDALSQDDMTNASWGKSRFTATTVAGIVPSGTGTFSRLTETADTGNHACNQSIVGVSAAAGEKHIHSIYIKPPAGRCAVLGLGGTAFSSVNADMTVDFAAAKVISQHVSLLAAECRAVGGGWYQLSVARATTAAGDIQFRLFGADAAGAISYLGSTGIYFDVWRAYSKLAEEKNTNLFGFARGMSKSKLSRLIGKRIRDGYDGGTGGGAFGPELGAEDVIYEDCIAIDCYRAVRVAAQSGDWGTPTFAKKIVTGLTIRNLTAIRCGTAFFAHSVGGPAEDRNVSDQGIYDFVVDGLRAVDCGHSPWRIFDYVENPTISPQKCGVINLGNGRNGKFTNVRVKINSDLTTRPDWLGRAGYPAVGSSYIGAGQTGDVGALVWGHGRDLDFDEIALDGNVGIYHKCARAITFGDLASVTPTSGSTGNCEQFRLKVKHVYGNAAYAFDGQVAADGSLDNTKLSILIEMQRFAALTSGVIGPNGTGGGLTNVKIRDQRFAGITVDGTAAQFLANGNVIPGTGVGEIVTYGAHAFGGGYSSTGASYGTSFDPALNIWRYSSTSTASQARLAFYTPGGLVGSISTTNTATAFNTSSDEILKKFIGEYSAEKAFKIIKADPTREFTWISSGKEAIGWGAQTSYKVSEDLATPGYWSNPITGETVEEGTEIWINPLTQQEVAKDWVCIDDPNYYGLLEDLHNAEHNYMGDPALQKPLIDNLRKVTNAISENASFIYAQKVDPIYHPWGVDQGKRTPYLWAAVSGLIDIVQELRAEIAELKSSLGSK